MSQKCLPDASFLLLCTEINFGWGSATDPAMVAYCAPPDPLACGEGLAAPPQNLTSTF